MTEIDFPSSKRSKAHAPGWEGFFPYYAGFPESFANSVISQINLSSSALIFDPWNGSGTTTYAASAAGYASVGHDLNPAMVVIAKARLLQPSEADSIEPLGKEIIREALSKISKIEPSDPLNIFFGAETAELLRAIEISIRHHLVGNRTVANDGIHFEKISSLAASNYVALFSVCRALTSRFRSSNPTWLRHPGPDERRIGRSTDTIVQFFGRRLNKMADALSATGRHLRTENVRAEIRVSDSTRGDLQSNSVDLILTSPPYCTRIDYTSATKIELCVLDPLLKTTIRDLGAHMLGTTQITQVILERSKEWGTTCNKFLQKVESHSSKASKTYYYKTHLDYFDKLDRSLSKIVPCLKESGSAVFVVQDSFYKDVHNDLPCILTEMGAAHGLSLKQKKDFYFRQSMAGVNPRSKMYKRRPGAVESVLLFQKG